MSEQLPPLTGAVLDETFELTFDELCQACAVHADAVMEMIAEGLLEPLGREPAEWRFAGPAVQRVQVVVRLQRDLQVNLAGAALIVELLEELQELRLRVRTLQRRTLE